MSETRVNLTVNGVLPWRNEWAKKSRTRWEEAVAMCGPGHKAYFVWVLTDTLKLEEPRRVYGWRGEDGPHPRSPEEAFGELVNTRRDDGFTDTKGREFKYFRYHAEFGSIEEPYVPVPQATLDQRKVKREEKKAAAAAAKDAAAFPLLAGITHQSPKKKGSP